MASAATRAYVRDAVLEEMIAIARAEDSGDEFACLDDNDCISPGGHLFVTSCGETKCVHCPKIAWR